MSIAVIGAAAVLGLLLGLAVFLPMGRAFSRELKYVNMKLMNSRSNQEHAYWKRRKKRLWMSLLPFCSYDREEHDHHHHRHHHE